jgi:hypothetical protein
VLWRGAGVASMLLEKCFEVAACWGLQEVRLGLSVSDPHS